MDNYEVKGGEKRVSASGMERHREEQKIDYSLALDGPMFERLAIHLTKALAHYEPRNWMKASKQEDMERFRRSAVRHFYQWLRGDTDEDHAAAVFFNINGYEYAKARVTLEANKPVSGGPC
jgi:hypothetical protein